MRSLLKYSLISFALTSKPAGSIEISNHDIAKCITTANKLYEYGQKTNQKVDGLLTYIKAMYHVLEKFVGEDETPKLVKSTFLEVDAMTNDEALKYINNDCQKMHDSILHSVKREAGIQ